MEPQQKQSKAWISLPAMKMKFQNVLSMYYLTFCFAYVFMLLLYPIPAQNKDVLNVITGVVITSGLGLVLNFWLGSSKSSDDKNEMLSKALNNTKEN